jgi:putative oxidoreductase
MPNPLRRTNAPRATILIRLLVGGVFLAEGIQKFLFPAALGVGRFVKIGIPAPQFFAPFVGVVEMVCATLLIIGFITRLAAILLLIDISVAIATTKIPRLSRAGFWSTVHEARTDYCMLLGLVFLLLVGSGPLSIDGRAGRSLPTLGLGRLCAATPTARIRQHARRLERRF